MGIIKFFSSRAFVVSAVAAGALCVGSYFVVDSFLTDYTRWGQTVEVPKVVGKHVNELPELLEKKGFRYEILDSIYDRTKTQGTVIEQNPSIGQQVKEGRKIYIKIIARSRKKIKLNTQNVIGSGSRIAMEILESMDVQIDSVEFKEHHFENIVLAVKHRSGKEVTNDEMVYAGSKLILVVSKTGTENIPIPQLNGLTLREAQKKLLLLNLQPSIFVIESNCQEKIDSSVVKVQYSKPAFEEIVKSGSKVSVFYKCQ
jgi:eukaryotic-like serine/threonine-protein kinase